MVSTVGLQAMVPKIVMSYDVLVLLQVTSDKPNVCRSVNSFSGSIMEHRVGCDRSLRVRRWQYMDGVWQHGLGFREQKLLLLLLLAVPGRGWAVPRCGACGGSLKAIPGGSSPIAS